METSSNHHANSPHSSNSSSSSTTTATTTTTTTTNSQPPHQPPISPRPITRSEPTNPYPTTFVQADTSSFKQVVQMLTGSPTTTTTTKPDPNTSPTQPHRIHNIPPIKSHPKKWGSGSGFELYERRNCLKHLKISTLTPFSGQPGTRTSDLRSPPVVLSPSILDFPSLVLSPVTPLTHDPFTRSASTGSNYTSDESNPSPNFDPEVEEKAIREKGFFLHPSPSTTPRDAELRLLPLFPTTSSRVSGVNFDSN